MRKIFNIQELFFNITHIRNGILTIESNIKSLINCWSLKKKMRIGKKESEILRLYNERKGKKMKYLERINAMKYQRTTTKY